MGHKTQSNSSLVSQVTHFIDSAERNWGTAKYLYKGQRYSDCLLFCHLSIEKLLKALVTNYTEDYAPYIHDLVKLAKLAGISLSEAQISELREITSFNMLARYDDEKDAFFKKASKDFTETKFNLCGEYRKWLLDKFPEKYKLK